MGLLSKIYDIFSTKAASVPLFSAMAQRSFFGLGSNRKNGDYYRGWVFRCVSSIKDDIAKTEFVLQHEDDSGNITVIKKHPVLKLLKQVNPYFTRYQLLERLAADLELYGNHYWLIEVDSKGTPVEIYPLFPTSITPIDDPATYVKYYEYVIGAEKYQIPATRVIHFKNYNPTSFTSGLSTIEAAKVSIDTDEAAKVYNRQFFENSATPGIILEYPGTINAEAQKVMQMQWDEQYKGFKKAYRTAVAAGGLKIHQMEYKQSDMQFIEQRRFNRDEIFALFGVPPTIAGINEATVYAGAKAAEYQYTSRTIDPKQVRITDTLTEFLLPLYKDTKDMSLKHVSIIPKDEAAQANFYQIGINNGFLSPNDVRRMEGLPELEDGESVYLPFSLAPYSKPAQKIIQEKPTVKFFSVEKSFIEGMVKDIVDVIQDDSAENKEEEKLFADKWTSEEFDQIGEKKIKARNPRTSKFEKMFEKTSQKLFDGQKKRVLDNLSKEKAVKFKVDDIFDIVTEIDITLDLFKPLFGEVTEEEGRAALEALGLDPDDFSINTPTMQEFLKSNTKLFSGGITQTTSEGIRAVINEGLDAGEAIEGIKKRVMEYAGFSPVRAEMIARTETIRAQGKAEVAAWKESKVVSGKVWYTALDERVCQLCEDMHGTEVEIGGEFLNESEMQDRGVSVYDGPVEAPPLHIQCRCTLIPIVK